MTARSASFALTLVVSLTAASDVLAGDDARVAGEADTGANDAAGDREARPAPLSEADAAYAAAAKDASGIYHLSLETCLDAVRRSALDDAERCYRRGARALDLLEEHDRAKTLLLLADTSAALGLTEVKPPPDDEDRLAFGDFVLSGKAEFVVASTGYGAWLVGITSFSALFLRAALLPEPPSRLELSMAGGAPLLGMAAGFVGSGSSVLLLDTFSNHDASMMRVAMLAGTFNSVLLPLALNPLFEGAGASTPALLGIDAALMLGAGLSALSAGLALSAMAEVPEGTSSLALSLGGWSAVVALLVGAMVEGDVFHPWVPGLALAAGDLGLLAGYATAPFFPMTRPETWLVDAGAALGGLTAGALAFGFEAPNPAVGWGSIAGGVVVGGAVGFATAKVFPVLVEMMPTDALEPPALSPLMVPSLDGRSVAYGGVLSVPISL